MAAVVIGVDRHKASQTAVVISAAEEPLRVASAIAKSPHWWACTAPSCGTTLTPWQADGRKPAACYPAAVAARSTATPVFRGHVK